MKILVFGGSGKMGAAVAWDLVKQYDVEVVGLVGRRRNTLEGIKEWIDSPKIKTHALDIAHKDKVTPVMKQYDVGVIALPDRRTSYMLAETAIQAHLDIVDMLEEYHRRPDPYETEGLKLPEGMKLDEYGDWLHNTAIENDVVFLDGIGFAPGISNITVGEGIRKLDRAERAVARVGGIPSKASANKRPLRYMITWSFDHVLREYMIKLNVIKDGKIVEVEAASDREVFQFSKFGINETLECAITPGMPSFIYTRTFLKEFSEKTIRWPGHWQGVETLRECGMLDLDPIIIGGSEITPRDFFLAVIEPKLKPDENDTDVCVMWNTVSGIKNGKEAAVNYYLWDEMDTENGISSMARVTGFAASIGALFIGRGRISKTGIVPPEDCIEGKLYDDFIRELKERDITVLEDLNFNE